MSPMIQGLEIEDMFWAHQNKLDLIVNDDKFIKKPSRLAIHKRRKHFAIVQKFQKEKRSEIMF